MLPLPVESYLNVEPDLLTYRQCGVSAKAGIAVKGVAPAKPDVPNRHLFRDKGRREPPSP